MANTATDKIVLEVEARATTGSGSCGRMRRQGRIPGNVYGLGRPPFMVSVNPRRIDELLRRESGVNTVFQLSLAGENRTREAMIKELQRDPVSGLPVHVDFIRVDPTKKIHVSVPVRLIGTPEGVKNEGGIVEFVNRVVHVECLPGRIPEHLDIDISALHVNQHVSVGDLPRAEGVEILDSPEQIIAVVSQPKAEELPAVEEVAPAETTEPEVAKKGKEAAGAEGPAAPEKKE